eukprot:CAMPEP_0174375430 /NCGR_PEP_ID=MMETSP0811_2-20130205/114558_1 /TAXON_ID=73025 ORGANISM="Eutreptiella gymnastica-like, Strain CCMP1594" /NCGR_SAMPLE_ID=MMETSP0811_2 /ASSEMBLY_ACC=CAM_ASM_000667 /LENGTH=59 /DNA_ID=CAMNT_0015525649 /DNA_START=850 /DNA_END=1030 /DNA_ORIENTATION=-
MPCPVKKGMGMDVGQLAPAAAPQPAAIVGALRPAVATAYGLAQAASRTTLREPGNGHQV